MNRTKESEKNWKKNIFLVWEQFSKNRRGREWETGFIQFGQPNPHRNISGMLGIRSMSKLKNLLRWELWSLHQYNMQTNLRKTASMQVCDMLQIVRWQEYFSYANKKIPIHWWIFIYILNVLSSSDSDYVYVPIEFMLCTHTHRPITAQHAILLIRTQMNENKAHIVEFKHSKHKTQKIYKTAKSTR